MMIVPIKLPNGLEWEAFSKGMPAPLICIPTDQLGDLSPEEIGYYVLRSVYDARKCDAYHTASEIDYLIKNYMEEEDIAFLESKLRGFEDLPKIRRAHELVEQSKAAMLIRLQKEAEARKPQPGFIYVLEEPINRWYKIGRAKNVERRLLGIELPFKVNRICSIPTNQMIWAERDLHQHFAAKRLNGEWFHLDAQDVEWLLSLEHLNSDKVQE